MTERPLQDKSSQVAARGDLNSLVNGGVFNLSRFENDIGQVTDEPKGFEKLKSNIKEKVIGVVETVKKDIGYGAGTNKSSPHKAAYRVLGIIRKKAFRSPWVAISTALAVGFLLGSLIRPTRKFSRLFK